MKSHVPLRARALPAVAAGSAMLLAASVGGAHAAAAAEQPTSVGTSTTAASIDVPDWNPADIAPRPYLGWSSWSLQATQNKDVNPQGYSSWLNEEHVLQQADAMISTGLHDAGYEYINIDAAWYADINRTAGFDENGRVTPNLERFPNGMKHVADEIHNRGLKAGIYTYAGVQKEAYAANGPIAYTTHGCTVQDAALKDASGNPIYLPTSWDNSYAVDFSDDNPCGYEYIYSVAKQFVDWGFDFLKLDGVTSSPGTAGSLDRAKTSYYEVAAWRKAFEELDWKGHFELSWALDRNLVDYWKTVASGVRSQGDVECYCETLTTWPYVTYRFAAAAAWAEHNEPGFFADLDSLLVGNGAMDGLTDDERRTTATLWSIANSPLYSGDDLTKLDDFGLSLLTNPEVLEQNQAGLSAVPVSMATQQQVWRVKNADGSTTVALFNLGSESADVTADFGEIGLGTGNRATVRDMWARADEADAVGSYTATLPAHGSKLIKLVPLGASAAISLDGDAKLRGGEVREVTTTVEAPAAGATDVRHELAVPEGWQAELVSAGATELGGGEKSTATWVVRAPHAGGDGTISFTGHATVDGEVYEPEATTITTVIASNERYLSDMRDDVIGTPTNGYGPIEWDLANGEQAAGDGAPLQLQGVTYDKGIGAHATSNVAFDLSGESCTAFRAIAGVDDRKAGSVDFEVWGDGVKLAGSGLQRPFGEPFRFDVDVTGVSRVELRAGQGGDGGTNDHADWALARVACGEVATPSVDPSVSVAPASVDAGETVEVTLAGFAPTADSSIAEVYLDDVRQGAVEVAADGTAKTTVTIPEDAEDGDFALEVRQWGARVDAEAYPSVVATITVGADTIRPEVTLVSPTTTGPFQVATIQIDATDDSGLSRIVGNIYQDGVLVKSTQTKIDGAVGGTHTATVELPEGAYTLKYNAQDVAGNISKTSTVDFVIDTTAPTATVKEGSSFTKTDGETYTLVSFKLHDAGKVDKVELNGTVKDLADNVWSDVNGIRPGVFGAVAGENTLVVYDVAGNASTTTFALK